MLLEDRKNFDHEICKRWKGKFDKPELDRWWSGLRSWGLGEVVESLNKFKDASRFVPKIGEILKVLPRKIGQEQQAKEEDPFSKVCTREMSNIPRDASVTEKLTRYWRSIWWQYKANADARRQSMDVAARLVAEREQVSFAEITQKRAFVDAVAMWETQYQGYYKKCWTGCLGSLIAEKVPKSDAQNAANWIESKPDQFEDFLESLRDVEFAKVFA